MSLKSLLKIMQYISQYSLKYRKKLHPIHNPSPRIAPQYPIAWIIIGKANLCLYFTEQLEGVDVCRWFGKSQCNQHQLQMACNVRLILKHKVHIIGMHKQLEQHKKMWWSFWLA